jgi:hypothetical protein
MGKTGSPRPEGGSQRSVQRRWMPVPVVLVLVLVPITLLAWHGSGARQSVVSSTTTSGGERRPASKHTNTPAVPAPTSPARRAFGLPPVPRGPVPGYVLIADRNNDRLLLVSPDKRVVWHFPRRGDIRPGQSFHDPDDAFFTPGYREISTNEEFNQQIALVSLRHRIVWSDGRAGIRGSARGEFSNPDDAYQLRNGDMLVADIGNCRVLRIARSGRIVGEIGSAGHCVHDPPRSLLSPNGATPLPDGGVLVTEIGGYVDRIDARGHLRWSIRTPTTYASDAQPLPDGNIVVAGFDTPPSRRHRPSHEAHRLAVRPPRGCVGGSRLPLEAGRSRSASRVLPGCLLSLSEARREAFRATLSGRV